jgi:sensor c-di-GMP phosphodiesterase-like protein
MDEAACCARLQVALADGRLRLLAQPIVDIQTGEAAGEELLLRLVSAAGRLNRPATFLRPVPA